MLSVAQQLRLLLWKAFVIKRRQKIWVCLEIAIPVLLFAILVLIRTRDFDLVSQECHYDAKSFPSAGLLPFTQSLLCSITNNCHSQPSTGDDKYTLSTRADKQSSLIKLARWLSSLLGLIGENPSSWNNLLVQLAQLVHAIANLKVEENNVTLQPVYPFAIFFRSENEMVQFLEIDLGFNKTDAQMFRNISVTTQFLQHLYQEVLKYSSANFSIIENILSSGEIDFLCDRNLTDHLFVSPNGEHRSVDFCQITFSSLAFAKLSNNRLFDSNRIMKNFANETIIQLVNFTNDSTISANSIVTDFNLVLDKVSKRLPALNFSDFTEAHFIDSIFCGNFSELLKRDTPNKQSGVQLSPELDKMKQGILKFVRNIDPSKAKKGGRTTCGSIIIEEDDDCKQFTSMGISQIKTLLYGRILVTPDSPVTRALISKIELPLRHLNLIRDSLLDFNQLSEPLQDALSQSDLYKAIENIIKIIPTDIISKSVFAKLKLLFSPSSYRSSLLMLAKSITNKISKAAKCFQTERFVFVANLSEFEQMAQCLSDTGYYLSAIQFANISSNSTEFPPLTTYTIRHMPKLVDNTMSLLDGPRHVTSRDDPWSDLKYLTFGFVFLQEAIEKGIVELVTNQEMESGIQAQQEPYPCVKSDTFIVTVFLSLFLILSWMIPASLLVKNIVVEKEMRLKEFMRVMGLGDSIHWLAWAIQSLILNFVSVMAICLLLKFGNILPKTDFSLLWTLLTLFSLACMCQCIFFSTCFSRANVATVCTSLLFYLLFYPFQLSIRSRSPLFSHITLILPQTAIGYGMTMVALAEDLGNATWHTLDSIVLEDYGMNLSRVLVALVIECLVYLLLAWYVNIVFPGAYGIGRPWYFFLGRKFWSRRSQLHIQNGLQPKGSDNKLRIKGSSEGIEGAFEKVQNENEMRKTVEISEMGKFYDNGTKALDGLNAVFYESEITAFLGHNGAGKSTTISILTGLYPTTSGTARVCDKDIRTEMSEIRKFLGLCPQHNILFDNLTVKEQLQFYGELKGIAKDKVNEEVHKIIEEIDLSDKKNELSCTLSGGMKRKLCIGIALIGDTKLLILDEPTAGIDSHARRSIWQLLLKHKVGRTIILCTHHMDEADVLADRIAIISDGKLKASGTSLFLKKRFGDGYKLNISKEIDGKSRTTKIESIIESEDIFKLYTNLQMIEENERELVYRIPTDMDPEELLELFEQLEQNKELFGIATIGLIAPSLQQIFLKISPFQDRQLNKTKQTFSCTKLYECLRKNLRRLTRSNYLVATSAMELLGNANANSDCGESNRTSYLNLNEKVCDHPTNRTIPPGIPLHIHHAKALFFKRIHVMKRSVLPYFAELVLPLCLLLFAEVYRRMVNPSSGRIQITQPPLLLTPSVYGNNTNAYFAIWNKTLPMSYKYLEAFTNSPGVGVRCVRPGSHLLKSPCDHGIAFGHLNISADLREAINYNVPQQCGFSESMGWNCTNDDYPTKYLQRLRLNTTDWLWDLTYRNISQFRLITHQNTTSSKEGILGGWTFGHQNPQCSLKPQLKLIHIGFDTIFDALTNMSTILDIDWQNAIENITWASANDSFNPNTSIYQLYRTLFDQFDSNEITKIWFNNKMWASLPINLNSYHNAVLRAQLPPNSSASEVGILGISHPMNETIEETLNGKGIEKTVLFRVVLIVLVLSIIPSSFAMFLVEENASFAKHLQLIFGISPWLYVLVNMLYDFLFYILCAFALIGVYFVMDVTLFTLSLHSFLSSLLLFILYGTSTFPLVYILQRRFLVPSMAFALISGGLYLVGVISVMAVILLENFQTDDIGLQQAHDICSVVFLVLPQYNLGMAIFRLNFLSTVQDIGKLYLENIGRPDLLQLLPLPNPMRWELMGKHCFFLAISSVAYFLILMILEYARINSSTNTDKLLSNSNLELDEDVLKEQQIVDHLVVSEFEGLVVKHLSKAYDRTKLAVNNLSFAVKKGECFGLLGVNGAGKTSTFSMLTGVLGIDAGEVFVDGSSIHKDKVRLFRSLGYCPQFDALTPKMTTLEHLVFFARIRGICEQDINPVVEWALENMQLRRYAREMASSLSGGNKRKLSAAIALVGDPPVILLDEPSAGMDPSSQQFMWNLIHRLRRSKRAVVITSHSMEECENLCTRTAIMVDGQFQCIGSIQHLKERFGNGYTFTLKITSKEQVEKAKELIEKGLPDAMLQSEHCTTIFYRLPHTDGILTRVFRVICEMHKVMKLEDYSLSQCTLDDVFISFALKSATIGTSQSES